MSRGKLLKGGAVLAAGNALSAVASFLRNLVVARLVSVEDFGIVVLLALAISAIETVSNLAIDRLLVQAPDGDDPELQANSHALQVARGIIGALAIYLCAPWVANLFKIPQATWAFQALALVPAIRGLMHLDSIRVQRDMAFGPTFWGLVIPQAVSLVLVIPLVYWIRDYSAVVWVMLAQAVAQTLVSHVLAERTYQWAWHPATMQRILSFGWPLLANGLLMFVVFEGDKAVIAAAFTPVVVGWYGAAFMLTIAPAMFLTSIQQSLALPSLSRLQHDPCKMRTQSDKVIHASLVLAMLVAQGFIVFGPELLRLLFGDRYSEGASVVIVLGVTQGLRVAKGGQFAGAIAIADTKIPLLANLARGGSMIVAALLVSIGFGPFAVALCGLVGEAISYFLAMALLGRRLKIRCSENMPSIAWWCGMVLLAYPLAELLRLNAEAVAHVVIGLVLVVAFVGGFVFLSRGARELAMALMRK